MYMYHAKCYQDREISFQVSKFVFGDVVVVVFFFLNHDDTICSWAEVHPSELLIPKRRYLEYNILELFWDLFCHWKD